MELAEDGWARPMAGGRGRLQEFRGGQSLGEGVSWRNRCSLDSSTSRRCKDSALRGIPGSEGPGFILVQVLPGEHSWMRQREAEPGSHSTGHRVGISRSHPSLSLRLLACKMAIVISASELRRLKAVHSLAYSFICQGFTEHLLCVRGLSKTCSRSSLSENI